ncbi:ovochymase-2 isoform X2 [Clupea harengus]|uniref:Ovochymase-2 isoform X2 n=1 Tax=Clupea harengus TaxID=7950 RepID=A0A8M1KL59_CLUHA|nr:ovochymase-2 isoform X2 [Clupea harengus]
MQPHTPWIPSSDSPHHILTQPKAPQSGLRMATSGMKFIAALFCVTSCLHLGITVLLQGPKCGFPQVESLLDRSLRIVGGTEALYGSHPWLVSLRSGGLHFCGASIITERWILTAAHCFYSMSKGLLPNVIAIIGDHDQRVADQGEQRFRLKRVRIHEKYRTFSPMNYDIALLELDGLIQFGEHVQPLCLPLPSEKFPPRTSCIVGGWGRVRERGRLPPVLREVMVDLVEPARCKHALQTLRPRHTPLTVVCAGPERGGRDACQGDSGGPLFCPRADGHWTVVGITSWGKGCGRSWIDNLFKAPNRRGSPGVFTDVKVLLPWIKRTLKEAELKTYVFPSRLCHVLDGALTERQGVISNPDKPAEYYANNEICSWSINTSAGNHILLEFLKFDLENDTLCQSDQLTVLGDTDRVIGKFCGSQLPEPVLITSSSATIQFVSDASVTRAGFSIQYKAVAEDFQLGPGCGTVALLQAQGAIQSPRYPEAYGNNADCRWVIHAPKGHVVKLDFHDFDLEHSEYCQYDSLKILGDLDGKQEIVVLCGGTVPPPVLSYDSVMVLQFTSDSSVSARGFNATPTFINRSDLQEDDSTELDESDGTTVHSRQVQTGLCGMPHSPAASELGEPEGGEGASQQPWPRDVRVHLGTEVICLGAIIQPDWILTAAHCVHGLDEKILAALTVETRDPDSQRRRVRKVLLHPQYEPSTLDSDVALLQLDSELVLTDHTQLICLPSLLQGDSLALDCQVTLGSIHGTNTSQSVEESLVEHADCERYYPGRLTDTMLCAEHKELNGYSSCVGHAGAPLVCRPNDSNFFVLGVASWSEGCGKFPRPAVYSSVPLVVDWILQQFDVTLDSELEEDPDEKDFRTESSVGF